MQDNKIIDLFFKKDEQALKYISDKYQKYAYKIAHNILNNYEDILEVINDSYLALWNLIPPNKPENLQTYFGKIVRNKAIDKYRQLKAKKRNNNLQVLSFEELENDIPDNFFKDNLNEAILTQSINNFLKDLKEKERNIFICRYWYFDSIKDISKRYLYSESKVKMSLKRTREQLKEYLIKEGYENGK